MVSMPEITVVIPTYNRKPSLLRALDSLARQSLPPGALEVIIVDDGSGYDEQDVTDRDYPFHLSYIRRQNGGATTARNDGARRARGDVLVFIDDDVTVSPGGLLALRDCCCQAPNRLVVGTLLSRTGADASPFSRITAELDNRRMNGHGDQLLSFVECNTQLLCVKKDDFFRLGMLQDPAGGWPNWDDVDFGYRAHRAGMRLLRCASAIGEHWDYSLADVRIACARWRRAGRSAVRLFQTHPGLLPHLPMFYDKTPIDWRRDPLPLLARKIARRLSTGRFSLVTLEKIVRFVEAYYPRPFMLRPLYRWMVGSYIFLGFQDGSRVQTSQEA